MDWRSDEPVEVSFLLDRCGCHTDDVVDSLDDQIGYPQHHDGLDNQRNHHQRHDESNNLLEHRCEAKVLKDDYPDG